jgi:hypothetical protein
MMRQATSGFYRKEEQLAMDTAEWIEYVARLRGAGQDYEFLREGHWRGYGNSGDGHLLRGRYVLVRGHAPTIAVSDDAWHLALLYARDLHLAVPVSA